VSSAVSSTLVQLNMDKLNQPMPRLRIRCDLRGSSGVALGISGRERPPGGHQGAGIFIARLSPHSYSSGQNHKGSAAKFSLRLQT
jgi:hypothetical protein